MTRVIAFAAVLFMLVTSSFAERPAALGAADQRPYFEDQPSGWASDNWNRAKEAGVVKGYDDGKSYPGEYATRQEALALAHREAGMAYSETKKYTDGLRQELVDKGVLEAQSAAPGTPPPAGTPPTGGPAADATAPGGPAASGAGPTGPAADAAAPGGAATGGPAAPVGPAASGAGPTGPAAGAAAPGGPPTQQSMLGGEFTPGKIAGLLLLGGLLSIGAIVARSKFPASAPDDLRSLGS